jgi:hypothetical protein
MQSSIKETAANTPVPGLDGLSERVSSSGRHVFSSQDLISCRMYYMAMFQSSLWVQRQRTQDTAHLSNVLFISWP